MFPTKQSKRGLPGDPAGGAFCGLLPRGGGAGPQNAPPRPGFWGGGGNAAGKVMDDRANAMAILTGLADMKDAAHRNRLHDVLVTVFNSTTYMEGYVLEALCVLGYKEDAYKRMMSRYYPLIVNENSTIWEDFFILGTKNHAWSGAPLTIVWRYFKELIRYTASEA